MASLDLEERHAVAVLAARDAGRHLGELYGRRGDLVVEQKGRNDFVSRADREAEAMIKAVVARRFPQDGFIGEESGLSGADQPAVTWVVDPLDGTTNFLKGAHNWCVSIGIVVAGVAVIGVVFDPLRDEMFESCAGSGARMNGQPLRIGTVDDPAAATIGLGFVERVGATQFCDDTLKLLSAGLSFRQVGAGALMLAYVAAGRVDSYFERHMWPWDALGGIALIREAGGVVLPYPSGPDLMAGSPVLAARPGLYARLSAIVSLQAAQGADPGGSALR